MNLKTLCVVAATIATASIQVRAEEVQAKERFFLVKYKDGTAERYKVRWQALRDIAVREEGGPAKPFEGKFVDDRRCHWDINARIERRLYMVAKSGQTFAKEDAFKSYNSDFANQGSSFMLAGFRSENCNDAAARRDSDWNDTKNKLLAAFDGVVKADLENVKKEIRSDSQVLAITEQ